MVRPFNIYPHAYSLLPFPGEPWSTLIDLSKATKLCDMVFQPVSLDVEWITMALRTVTPEHRDLRQISIRVPCFSTLHAVDAYLGQAIGETTRRQWSDLDHLLVRFWEARSIRPIVVCRRSRRTNKDMRDRIEGLLPEVVGRGVIIDLVEI